MSGCVEEAHDMPMEEGYNPVDREDRSRVLGEAEELAMVENEPQCRSMCR